VKGLVPGSVVLAASTPQPLVFKVMHQVQHQWQDHSTVTVGYDPFEDKLCGAGKPGANPLIILFNAVLAALKAKSQIAA
jgi:hypothetical protein